MHYSCPQSSSKPAPCGDTQATVWKTQMENILLDESARRDDFIYLALISQSFQKDNGIQSWLSSQGFSDVVVKMEAGQPYLGGFII